MRFLSLILTACGLSLSGLAFAADPQIEIQQSVYSYSKATTDNKTTARNTRTTDEGFTTMPSDLEIAVRDEKWEFSVFPTQPGGANFEILNEVLPHFAAGVNLGATRSSHDGDDGRKSIDTSELGPMCEYEPVYGDNGVELELKLDYVRSTSKTMTPANGLVEQQNAETNSTGYQGEATAMYVRRMTDNLHVAAGVGYTYGRSHEKIANVDSTTGQFEFTVLQLRAGIY